MKLGISLALFALLATLVGNLLAQGLAMSDDHNMMLTKPALAQDGVVAWDDFEMDSRSGGAGWLSEWDGGSVTHYDAPHQGIYHLRFATYGGKSSIKRSVDLSGESDLSLQFWLKADGLGGDRYVECRVSPDGETWYPAKAWTDSQPYRFQEVDLSSYPMTSEFFIQFILDGAGSYVNSHAWIDDIRVVNSTSAPPPTPTADVQDGVVAWDDFEMDSRSGGAGWLSEWDGGSVTHYDAPHQGIYHLRFATYGGKSSIKRSVDLSGESDLSLQFWLKADGLGGDRYVECRVSPDGETWYPVKAWTDSQPYRFQEVDLSSYPMTSEFFIQFILDGAGSYVNSHAWIDDIRVVNSTSAPPPTPTVPSAPADFSGSAVSSTHAALTWQDNSDSEDGFKIERRVDTTGDWAQIAKLGANVVTYTDTGLSPGTTYEYRVRAYNEAGNSDYSNSTSVTTGEAPPPPPTSDTTAPTITNVSVKSITETSASITWTTDEPATGQVEYGKTAQYGSAWTLEQIPATTHLITLTDLEPETTYHYRVRSRDEAGNEVVSPDKTFSTSGTTSEASLPTQASTALPPAPAVVSPMTQRFGWFGSQIVAFTWTNVTAPSGITYTLEIADNLNFFPLAPSMQKTELTEPTCIVDIEPGTYYWRVKAIDGAGNESDWALSPYPFKVGYSSSFCYLVVGGVATLVLVTVLPISSRRKRLAREAKVVKEYEVKLMQWEREGYNVSHLRSKWFRHR